MRNDAPSVLAEWAALANAETRRLMGVSVAPEIPERQEARAYLSGLLSDEEAAARVAADMERVRSLGERPRHQYGGLSWSFAAACRAADEKQRRKPVDPAIERARALMADPVTLEQAQAEVSKPPQIPIATLRAAEFLLQQKDPARLRHWLSQHSAPERKAILQHLEQHKKGGGDNG
jgi:hypothetical protein